MPAVLARRPWLTTLLLAVLGGGLAAVAHSRLAIWPAAMLAPAVMLPLGLGTTRRQRHGETRGSARSSLGTSTGRSAACADRFSPRAPATLGLT